MSETKSEVMSNIVFRLSDGAWRIIVNGEVVRTTFNSKGAAQAGIEVERHRRDRDK